MKLFFMSDIHGSLYYLTKALENYEREAADYICILGDELYHGARNPLPRDYDTQGAARLLNKYADRIIAVRGNCDSEIDELVLDYPMMSTYSSILYNGRRIVLSHGHIYSDENLPPMKDGDVFAFGHIHLPRAEKKGGVYILNPGSVTFPKENNPNSYGVLENNVFCIKDLEGRTFMQLQLE